MANLNLSRCQSLAFSEKLAEQRLDRFAALLGIPVLKRMLCLCLYLLGATRSSIAEALDLPLNTARSLLQCVGRDGLPALEDRRRRSSHAFLPPASAPVPAGTDGVTPFAVSVLRNDEETIELGLGCDGYQATLALPRASSPLQTKVVLLSFLEAGLMEACTVGDLLGCTSAHAGRLVAKLAAGDVEALVDGRRGQQLDYRVDEQTKGLLIEQFVLAIAADGKVSARSLAERLETGCALSIAQRTVGHHMKKLGLSEIKNRLRDSLADLKKTPGTGSGDADQSANAPRPGERVQ
jgi:DNA-binding transcriptional ArsR family regulator